MIAHARVGRAPGPVSSAASRRSATAPRGHRHAVRGLALFWELARRRAPVRPAAPVAAPVAPALRL